MKLLQIITLITLIYLSSAYNEDECTFYRHVKPIERLNFLVCVINFDLSPQISRVTRHSDEPINGVIIGDSESVFDPSLTENFPELTYYAMLNHKIEILKKENLAELTNLEGFDLSKGELKRIELESFHDMAKLRDIDLSGNKLDYIHPEIFNSLTNLEKLNLNGNQLVALEIGTFTTNKKLTMLSMKDNKITYISPRAFEGIFNMRELYFSGNPCINMDYKPPRIPQLRFVFAQQCKESNELIEMLSEKRADVEGFESNYEDFQEE